MAAGLSVLSGSLLAWLLLGRPLTGIDDADIFLVYARHLAEGHGFVYNIGGGRVEGFTSMLWVGLCAGLFSFFKSVEGPLLALSLFFSTLALWICLKRLERGWLFLPLIASSPAWFAWCNVTLMESGLWCLLLTLMVLATIEHRIQALLCTIPMVVLCRPEAMLWCAWSIIVLGIGATGNQGWKKGVVAMVWPGLVFILSLAGLVAFRLAYFGWPLPNTYYAKVSNDLLGNAMLGSVYLFTYVFSNPAVLLTMATLAWVVIRGIRRKEWNSKTMLLGMCLLPGVAIPVLVGGDHFGGFRFYQPIWPLLCLLSAWEWPRFFKGMKRSRQRNILALLVVGGWALFPLTAKMQHEFRIAREGRATGVALEQMFSDLDALPTVSTITAGGIKFAYQGRVYDVLGLNSAVVAHAPGGRNGYKNHAAFNRNIFYAWHPDILLRGDSHQFDLMVLKGLHDEPEFNALYRAAAISRNGKTVSAYYSRDFLDRIGSSLTVR